MPLIRNKYYSWAKIILLSIIIGVTSGIVAIVFDLMLNLYSKIALENLAGYSPPRPEGDAQLTFTKRINTTLLAIVITLGGLISGVLVYSLAPEAEGHGTDSAIAAFHRFNGIIRKRVPLIKLISCIFVIGSGGSAGREGPMAQIGAGVGTLIADILHLGAKMRRMALVTGIGAGIGTIFKAPLGGALFGVEVLYKKDFEIEALIPAIVASVIGYSIFGFFTGYRHIFPVPSVKFKNPIELVFYAILGVTTGILGLIYVKTFYYTRSLFSRIKIPNYFKPAIGGLVVGIIAMLFPQITEMGYGWITLFINEKYVVAYINGKWIITNLWYITFIMLVFLAFLKIIATSFTVGTGGSGGVFAPGLFIGASIGAALGILFVNLLPGAIADRYSFLVSMTIIGMMSFFGGVSKSPIAVMIMVSEMTGSYELLAPSMLATTLSYLITGSNTIYHEQVDTRESSPAHIHDYIILKKIIVEDIMRRDIPALSPDTSSSEALNLMALYALRGLPVIKDGKIVGMVSYEDIKVKVDPASMNKVKVKDVMTKKLVVTHPEETVYDALIKLLEHDVAQLPVVDRNSKLIGIITRKDIRKAYDLLLSKYVR